MEWRPFKHVKSAKDRLLEEAQNLRDEARLLPPGPLREAALKKARQTEAAAHMDDWCNSPGLQPPKNDTPGPQ
jgi:tetraacyldisaccharide-1-P 4'-kinase